jgi:hypothetical protein
MRRSIKAVKATALLLACCSGTPSCRYSSRRVMPEIVRAEKLCPSSSNMPRRSLHSRRRRSPALHRSPGVVAGFADARTRSASCGAQFLGQASNDPRNREGANPPRGPVQQVIYAGNSVYRVPVMRGQRAKNLGLQSEDDLLSASMSAPGASVAYRDRPQSSGSPG